MAIAATAAISSTQAPAAVGGGRALGARSSCRLSARLRAGSHHPRANKNWWVAVTTRPASVLVHPSYVFYFEHSIQSTQYPFGDPRFAFRGHFTDPGIVWPAAASNLRLTFSVHLTSRCGTSNLDYSIVVRR